MEFVLLTDGGRQSQQLQQTCVHGGKAERTDHGRPWSQHLILHTERNQTRMLPSRQRNIMVKNHCKTLKKREQCSFETSGHTRPMTERHVPKDMSFQQHLFENSNLTRMNDVTRHRKLLEEDIGNGLTIVLKTMTMRSLANCAISPPAFKNTPKTCTAIEASDPPAVSLWNISHKIGF